MSIGIFSNKFFIEMGIRMQKGIVAEIIIYRKILLIIITSSAMERIVSEWTLILTLI